MSIVPNPMKPRSELPSEQHGDPSQPDPREVPAGPDAIIQALARMEGVLTRHTVVLTQAIEETRQLRRSEANNRLSTEATTATQGGPSKITPGETDIFLGPSHDKTIEAMPNGENDQSLERALLQIWLALSPLKRAQLWPDLRKTLPKPEDLDAEEFANMEEATTLLGVSRARMVALVDEGKLPAIRDCRNQYHFPKTALQSRLLKFNRSTK